MASAGLTAQDASIVRVAYPAMDLIARCVIVPLAFGALMTGLVQALGTPWGLFRHYWGGRKARDHGLCHGHPADKDGVDRSCGAPAGAARAPGTFDLQASRLHAFQETRAARTVHAFATAPTPVLRPSIDFSKSVTITLPRAYVPAFVFVMLVAHVVVMHLAGIGLAVH